MKGINYRFYPLWYLAFLRVAIGMMIGLATPLYFIEEGLNPEILGFLISATALAYLFSPFLLRNVPKKIGIKKSLIIAMAGSLIVQIGFQISLDPLVAFILRFADGVFLGLFWPVIQGSISIISTYEGLRENNELKDKVMNLYSIYWNVGGVFSYALGTIVLFFIENVLLMFDISLIYAIIGFILVFVFEEPKSNLSKENFSLEQERLKPNSQREHVKFPIFIPLFLMGIYALLLSSVGLIYPAKSEFLDYAVFTNYLFFFIRLSVQAFLISQTMRLSINSFKKIMPYLIITLSLCLLIWGLTENLIILAILFAIFGVCISFFYSFSFKLVIFRNIAEDTTKYSMYFETAAGICFFIGPILSGFLIAIDFNLAFFIMSFITLISLIFYLSFKNKIKSEERKQKDNI